MQTLRHVRRTRTSFLPRFFEASPLFWPLDRAARTFAAHEDWPSVPDYNRAFANEPPVTFVAAPPKPSRAQRRSREDFYDTQIVVRRVVPTRQRCWHDFLNALVWASFPRAKLALHTRQHRAIQEWAPEGVTELPNARTRELDMLALIDEGGVVLFREDGREHPVIFGHALYEGLVLENRAMIARAVTVDVTALPASKPDLVRLADQRLAEMICDPNCLCRPEDLPRTTLS